MDQLILVFKALSEPLRLRILQWLLTHTREAYGEELANALSVPPYQLSRHLKVLKTSGLVHERRAGRWVYYSIAKGGAHPAIVSVLRRLLATEQAPEPQPTAPVAAAGPPVAVPAVHESSVSGAV